MPAKLEQVHRKLLGNQLNHCVGIRMHESLVRNEWPWAIQRASHVTQTMANEWVTDTQHLDMLLWAACENAQTESIKKRKSLPLCLAEFSRWDPRVPMKMFVGQNVFVRAEWNWGGKKKDCFSLHWIVCARVFLFFVLHQFKRIERNRGGQEILLNGKAAWLCRCGSVLLFFIKKRGRKR